MTIKLAVPNLSELKPRITVFGVGGAGGNAVNNMIESRLEGVEFVVANTDAQALLQNAATRRIQMGTALTQGLGAGSHPQIGAAAAEEALQEIVDHLAGSHMAFITAGMGGGTGSGAAPIIARAAREQGILTVGVVTKPFHFEGVRRMQTADQAIEELAKYVDTLIVIPNQNLFRVANEKTTFAAAFAMADQVLYSGVASITELMTKEGLINLDFADVRSIMAEMGKAMMGTGEASGEKRALEAAEAAISNPLLDDVSMRGARGLLISICGGPDLTLYEVDEAATRIREEVDPNANIILGATFDESLEGTMRVSVVATGLPSEAMGEMPISEEASAAVQAQPERKTYSIPQPSADARVKMTRQTHISQAHAVPEVAQGEHHYAAHDEVSAPVHHYAPSRPAPRMPTLDQFPRHAQEQVALRQAEVETIAEHSQRKRRGIFERLAEVGLGRKPDAQTAPVSAPSRRVEPKIRPTNVQQPVYHEPAPEPQLQATYDDDQLAIPAFLRRQANG